MVIIYRQKLDVRFIRTVSRYLFLRVLSWQNIAVGHIPDYWLDQKHAIPNLFVERICRYPSSIILIGQSINNIYLFTWKTHRFNNTANCFIFISNSRTFDINLDGIDNTSVMAQLVDDRMKCSDLISFLFLGQTKVQKVQADKIFDPDGQMNFWNFTYLPFSEFV